MRDDGSVSSRCCYSRREIEGLLLKRRRGANSGAIWLCVVCAALLLVSIAPARLSAQSAAPNTSSPPKRKTSATTASSKAVSGKSHATSSGSTGTPTRPVAGSKSTGHGSSAAHPALKRHAANANLAAHSSKPNRGTSRKSGSKKIARGQQKIDPERAEAIQEALVREHYLTGDPAGTWNQKSEDAMRRYQADHGWQSKEVPDSRALISLGLGPSHDHLLNPESAMTTGPAVSHAPPPTSTGQTPLSQGPQPGTPISAKPSPQGDPASANPSDNTSSGPQ